MWHDSHDGCCWCWRGQLSCWWGTGLSQLRRTPIALIGRDNSVILLWEGGHEDVILMLNSYRNIKCWHRIGFTFYAHEHCCHFCHSCSFSVDFLCQLFLFYSLLLLLLLLSPPFVLVTSSSPSKCFLEQLTHVQSLPTMPRLSHGHSLPPPHTCLSLFFFLFFVTTGQEWGLRLLSGPSLLKMLQRR